MPLVRLDSLLHCCSCKLDDCEPEVQMQIQLSSDYADYADLVPMRSAIPRVDSLDTTFAPRACGNAGGNYVVGFAGSDRVPRASPCVTPRQQGVKDRLQLPVMEHYPRPPGGGMTDDGARRQLLYEMYQEVALDLHAGMFLTQLTGSRDKFDIHCQLMEDLQTFKLDQSNGRLVEFPLASVSKVYRVVLTEPDDKLSGDHIVIVAFESRQLAFVFLENQAAQRFTQCMELLIRRAQQIQTAKAAQSVVPGSCTIRMAATPQRSGTRTSRV